jgi:4-hydroxybenzoate polyprenyltransferase
VFTFARQIGVAGAISLLVGGTGMIATSSQLDWDIARSLYLALVVLGPMAILIAQKFLRILMKHRRRELNIFDN